MNSIAMNQTFIVAAYAVTWLVLLGYMARLVRKGRSARRQYETVARGAAGVS
jgi:CcmD family protein